MAARHNHSTAGYLTTAGTEHSSSLTEGFVHAEAGSCSQHNRNQLPRTGRTSTAENRPKPLGGFWAGDHPACCTARENRCSAITLPHACTEHLVAADRHQRVWPVLAGAGHTTLAPHCFLALRSTRLGSVNLRRAPPPGACIDWRTWVVLKTVVDGNARSLVCITFR